LKVSRRFVFYFADLSFEGSFILLISFAGNVQACAPRWGTRPTGPAGFLQLLQAGAVGAAFRALETCQAVEEGKAQAGSSLASRLRALGGHVSGRMRRALHLGVQKALGVVRSHYEINFEAVAEGYIVS
jgi:hypothetical protein